MRIRSKLFSILIIMVTIPVFLITFFNYINAKNAIKDEVMTNLNLVAEGLEGALLEFIANKKQISTAFAYDGYIREKVEQILSIEGLENRERASHQLRNYLNSMIKTVDSDIKMIHILNLEGREIAGTDKDHFGDVKDMKEAYFLTGRKQPYIQTPLFHEHNKTKQHFIPFSAPVKNIRDNRTIGVLMVGYPVQNIKDILRGERYHELGAVSSLADQTTRTNIILVNHDGTYLIPPKRYENIDSNKINLTTEPVRKCLVEGEQINDEWKDPEGHFVWGASACLMPEYNWKWVLIVKKYREDALAPIAKFRNLSIMIGVLSLLIVSATAFSTSRAIAKPIQTLHEGTEIIGKGNLDYKVGTPVKDEIGQLSRAFDKMTENLKQVMASKNELDMEIAERKTAEKKIIQGKQELETILDSLPFGVVIIGKDKKIRSINNLALSLTGYESSEQIIGEACNSVICASETGKCPVFDLNKKLDGYEQILLTKDRRQIPVLKSAVPININDEEVFLEVFVDITDRKKSEQFINNIFESMGEGLIVIDRDLRIITANKAYCRQANISCGEIVGRHCYEISHHIDKPCNEAGEECPALNTFETGLPQNVIHTHYDKEGKNVYVEINTYPMKNQSGNIESIIEVTNDITEKFRLEEQLRHAQKLEAIGTLAGGIAHDFNNIITAIIGFGSLIDMHLAKDSALRPHLNEIFMASERATNLTQGLLSFSRKQVISLQPVNLNEMVKRVVKFLARLIGEDISLKTTFSDKDIIIKADSGQIEQVLMNLATNARDAMPKGGMLRIETGTIELNGDFIKAHGYGDPGRYALISVTDTGEGFDEAIREKIFEPFFTTKETGKGTGLGLAIVYGIIKQHNGYINCYSEKGLGTAFKIYLPLAKHDLKGKQETAIQTGSLPAGGAETVLIAEDDETLRKLLRTVLIQSGYKIVETVNGFDAVNKFIDNQDKIDLIILDFMMPKKNGKEAYIEIKKIRPDIKCIIMSGYTPDMLQKKGILDEGLDFIPKPVSPINLLKKIREILDT